jgi:hypothetical protein
MTQGDHMTFECVKKNISMIYLLNYLTMLCNIADNCISLHLILQIILNHRLLCSLDFIIVLVFN